MNRIVTVKKKYKVEKAEMESIGGLSRVRDSDQIDEWIGLSTIYLGYIQFGTTPMQHPFYVSFIRDPFREV